MRRKEILMDDDVKRVLRGFVKLSLTQKSEVMQTIEHYKQYHRLDEQVEKVLKVGMGPLGTPCPCCGR
jgi:hypothetical protein